MLETMIDPYMLTDIDHWRNSASSLLYSGLHLHE